MGNVNQNEEFDEELDMTIELELEDGKVTCAIITILTVGEQDYIVLLPLDEEGENEDGNVWIYRYDEDPDDETKDPELSQIEDDEEYEAVADAFDEYLDAAEFDELVEDGSVEPEIEL